jgi:LysR family transcriptional regulator, nitrogen assimilation regulatory protein
MDLRQLKFFLRIAEHGSLTKAAADLAVAQPVLSRQMRDLERELGVSLLSRNGRGMVLTEAGRRFLPRARSITQDAESASEELRSLRERPSGNVTVAMAPTAGAMLWVPLLAQVERTLPDVRLQVAEGYSGHVLEWLVLGRADVGVVYQPQEEGGLKHEVLMEERLYLVGAPEAPPFRAASIAFEELSRLPLILPAMPHAIRRLLESVATKRRLPLNVELEVNAYPAIKNIMLARRGFTVLPAASMLPEVEAGRVAIGEICAPALSQRLALAASAHHAPSAGTRAVCGVIKALVEELKTSGRWPARYRAAGAAEAIGSRHR